MESVFIHNEPSGDPVQLMDWEEDNPCKYVSANCWGKFGSDLVDCRDRREQSQALCEQARGEEEAEEEFLWEQLPLQQQAAAEAIQNRNKKIIVAGGLTVLGTIIGLIVMKRMSQ